MLSIGPNTKVYLCSQAVDMRFAFDALAGMVRSYFSMSPTSGHLFVFFSRQRDRMKLLFWDSEGFVLYYKRLERGTFCWLDELELSDAGEINAEDFAMVLAGVNSVSKQGKRERWKNNKLPPKAPPLQLV